MIIDRARTIASRRTGARRGAARTATRPSAPTRFTSTSLHVTPPNHNFRDIKRTGSARPFPARGCAARRRNSSSDGVTAGTPLSGAIKSQSRYRNAVIVRARMGRTTWCLFPGTKEVRARRTDGGFAIPRVRCDDVACCRYLYRAILKIARTLSRVYDRQIRRSRDRSNKRRSDGFVKLSREGKLDSVVWTRINAESVVWSSGILTLCRVFRAVICIASFVSR